MRIGVFGGTFNPIHYGHLRAAEETRAGLKLDKVVFIPSGSPPLKSLEIAEPSHRYSMTVLAASSNPHFEVSDMECKTPGRSYSVDTARKLRDIYAGDELFFILGIDAFMDIPNWLRPEELTSLIDFIVISRPAYGFKDAMASPYVQGGVADMAEGRQAKVRLKHGRSVFFLPITCLDISSTMIRTLLREGESVKYLLPEEVESYIMSNRLYTGTGKGS